MPRSSSRQFSGIFICYRRKDTDSCVDMLLPALRERFGKDRIFVDVDSIKIGTNYRKAMEEALSSSEILVAVIGHSWLSITDKEGRPRLDDPNDSVRLEIATALQRDITVIPLLVYGASMPRPGDLPDDLAELGFRNGFELHRRYWEQDVKLLLVTMEEILAGAREADANEEIPPPAPGLTPVAEPGVKLTRSARLLGLLPQHNRLRLIFVFAAGAIFVLMLSFVLRSWFRKPVDPPAPVGMVYVPESTVRPFFIDLYETTNEDYKKCLDAQVCSSPEGWVNRNYREGTARLPVTGVNWDAANTYAKWVGKRLPFEEEWEFAARGPAALLYPWGPNWKPNLANTGKPETGFAEGASGMEPVGSYPGVSPYGVYDMVGNAWEWTASDFRARPGDSLPPGLDHSADFKVMRGGSWDTKNEQATATFRRGYPARDAPGGYSYTGFRLAQDITPTSVNR